MGPVSQLSRSALTVLPGDFTTTDPTLLFGRKSPLCLVGFGAEHHCSLPVEGPLHLSRWPPEVTPSLRCFTEGPRVSYPSREGLSHADALGGGTLGQMGLSGRGPKQKHSVCLRNSTWDRRTRQIGPGGEHKGVRSGKRLQPVLPSQHTFPCGLRHATRRTATGMEVGHRVPPLDTSTVLPGLPGRVLGQGLRRHAQGQDRDEAPSRGARNPPQGAAQGLGTSPTGAGPDLSSAAWVYRLWKRRCHSSYCVNTMCLFSEGNELAASTSPPPMPSCLS